MSFSENFEYFLMREKSEKIIIEMLGTSILHNNNVKKLLTN